VRERERERERERNGTRTGTLIKIRRVPFSSLGFDCRLRDRQSSSDSGSARVLASDGRFYNDGAGAPSFSRAKIGRY